MSRRSFVVGLGAALGLLALPKVVLPYMPYRKVFLPTVVSREIWDEIVRLNHETGNPALLQPRDMRISVGHGSLGLPSGIVTFAGTDQYDEPVTESYIWSPEGSP